MSTKKPPKTKPVREPTEAELEAEAARRAVASERMQHLQERMAELRATGWKPTYKSPSEKARENPTPQKCIRAFCWECVGGGGDPGAKFRVRDCTAPKCPLYPVRPWQDIKGGIHIGDSGLAEPTPESEDTAEE